MVDFSFHTGSFKGDIHSKQLLYVYKNISVCSNHVSKIRHSFRFLFNSHLRFTSFFIFISIKLYRSKCGLLTDCLLVGSIHEHTQQFRSVTTIFFPLVFYEFSETFLHPFFVLFSLLFSGIQFTRLGQISGDHEHPSLDAKQLTLFSSDNCTELSYGVS